jgi:hypothetical protein
MAASRHSPLPMKVAANFMDVVNHVMALTQRTNMLSEHVDELGADMLKVAGETSRSNRAVLEQMGKVTEAMRELREALLPDPAHRAQMTTLPAIDTAEINAILNEKVEEKLNEKELAQRRSQSIRAKAEETDLKRDLRNAKYALVVALASGFLVEAFRVLLTGKL